MVPGTPASRQRALTPDVASDSRTEGVCEDRGTQSQSLVE